MDTRADVRATQPLGRRSLYGINTGHDDAEEEHDDSGDGLEYDLDFEKQQEYRVDIQEHKLGMWMRQGIRFPVGDLHGEWTLYSSQHLEL